MARFYGAIGYSVTKETAPGVWEDTITERNYYGDVIKNTRRLQANNSVNDNIQISNQISIVADPYAIQNFHCMKYVVWLDIPWKVTDIDVQYPRLILTIGGEYNGERNLEQN